MLPTLLLESCQGKIVVLCPLTSTTSLADFRNQKTSYILSSSRMPQLFTKDIALVQQFFESMCKVGERSLKSLTSNALKT